MKRLTMTLLVAGLMTLPACSHRHHRDDVAAGILGGAVVGAVAGALLADSYDDDRHHYVQERRYVVVERPPSKYGRGARRHGNHDSMWREERYSYRRHSSWD
ncbi:MAG: hypothetical protein HQL96_08075 [Magnetococcales bacterium]|nr:hypothetical protein [Magnetococcales bacterium]